MCRFKNQNVLYQNKYEKVCKAIDAETGENLIIHIFSYLAFQSNDLIVFIKSLIKYSEIKNDHLLGFYGFASDQKNFTVAYKDNNNLSLLNVNSLSESQKVDTIHTVAQLICLLHSAGLSHLKVRLSSIFVSNSNFYLGCISPRPSINIEDDDMDLPFCNRSSQEIDTFMFGILIFQILQNRSQQEIIDEFWEFKKENNDDKPLLIRIAYMCIAKDPKERPSFIKILELLNVKRIATPNNLTHEINIDFSLYNSVFFQLLNASILTENRKNEEAAEIYKTIDENCIALNNLGIFFFPSDKKRSFEYFNKACKQGYYLAQVNLGTLIVRRSFKEKSMEEGATLCRKAADQGSLIGIRKFSFELFEIHANEDAVNKLFCAVKKMDPFLTFAFYKEVFLEGYAKKLLDFTNYIELAVKYDNPYFINFKGVHEKDPVKAAEYFKRAADLDLPQAQFNYACCKLLGIGCTKDYKEAAKYMEMAVEHQYPDAMLSYAMMVKKGLGVPKDREKAEALCRAGSNARLAYYIKVDKSDKRYDDLIDAFNRMKEEEEEDKNE